MDDAAAPEPLPPLSSHITADLVVVGGGYSGLWTALLAKERDPSREVVLLEGRRVGWAASGRNGGFCAASVTHGLGNGVQHFPGEIQQLEDIGAANLDAIEDAVRRYGIDCDFARTGELTVATEPWQVDDLADFAETMREFGGDPVVYDAAGVRAQVNSPTYLGGVYDREGCAIVHPAKLAWGLRDACRGLGVRVHEHTPVTAIDDVGGDLLRLVTGSGSVTARRVALGTGVFPGPLRRRRAYAIPVYDYVLMTEPLDAERMAAIGWDGRQGVGDAGNQFHYYRLTADNRVLWGGYDAVYHYGSRIGARLDERPETFHKLGEHFFATFPQLDGVRFTHAWGGAIDTCSRFCAYFGRAYGGRLAYAGGYTGLGVGATRFGAQVMLDLLSGEETDLTRLEMVRSKPVPFPPEPLRSGVVGLTRWSIARADDASGRRNLWLRTLDRFGVGFDS
ncbi:MAG TPA: FAD-dependent oxidoreductase [Streptosporangiaceae bacterium]